MSTNFDISELEHELAALSRRPHLRRVAIVVPLAPGMRDMARSAIAEGPPFDPDEVGVDFHEVLLTERDAIFVFGLRDGPAGLERILASDDFWSVVRWWERVAGGRPYVADVAYDWHAA